MVNLKISRKRIIHGKFQDENVKKATFLNSVSLLEVEFEYFEVISNNVWD